MEPTRKRNDDTKKKDLQFYLDLMKKLIKDVLKRVEGHNYESFIASEGGIEGMNLVRVGSTLLKVKMLSPELFELNPNVDWVGIRNLWTSGVDEKDHGVPWDIVQNKLPKILNDLENLVLPPKPKGIFYAVKVIEFSENKEEWRKDLTEFEKFKL